MTRVGIIEDHHELRQSLEYLVSSTDGYALAWALGSVEAALEEDQPADILLLDINLPGIQGTEAIRLMKARVPGLKIIMLTILEDPKSILTAIQNGADGYILKSTGPGGIMEAIRQVRDGGAALTPLVARQVMTFLQPARQADQDDSALSPREKEVLQLITDGFGNDRIAERLFISPQTVRNHIKSIYGKLQVHSRSQVVAKALKNRLV